MANRSSKELKELEQELDSDGELLEAIVDRPAARRIEGVVIGTLHGLDAEGMALVEYPGCGDEPRTARATTAVAEGDVGREVALLFEGGDPTRPILVGCLQGRGTAPETSIDAEVDGRQVTLQGKDRVVLRCGKASITLTKDGRIALRGVHLLSRATRSNRIKGGSVQLN